MSSSLKSLIVQILGETVVAAEEIVPLFIHNPVSQKIEGVVVTTLNGVLTNLMTGATATPAAVAPATTPVPPAPATDAASPAVSHVARSMPSLVG
jgi:hypothetical protein